MTYLKTFAMFESQLSEDTFEAVNEAAVEAMVKVLPADIKKAGKKMTKEEATAAATEIAKKLKLKVSDLTDPAKVIAAMAKQTMVAESEAVLLLSIGLVSPKPSEVNLSAAIPLAIK